MLLFYDGLSGRFAEAAVTRLVPAMDLQDVVVPQKADSHLLAVEI